MSLFHKNTNEYNFAGGSKNIRESLQNDGSESSLLIHRAPQEDFNTGTVITVNPGEEALFVNNGEIVGVLSNGRHELSTENYPFLSRLRNMITGGMSTFHCRIFYVRTTEVNIPWGTANGIQYQDNWFLCPTTARGFGEYRVTFNNIPKFVEKVMGNQYSYTDKELIDYFNGQISSRLTDIVAQHLGEMTKSQSILALNSIKKELADGLKPEMQELLDDYGLELKEYFITNIEIEEDERRAEAVTKATQALAESRAKVQQAQGDVAAYNVYGETYQTIKGMEILKDVANNPGAGGVAGVGAGIGMAMGAVNAFGNITQSAFGGQQAPQKSKQEEELAQCKQLLNEGLITEEQYKLKQMAVLGLITQEQYNAKITEMMNRI
jgi:membrane protease subunit (stomatin/prohibitin family)